MLISIFNIGIIFHIMKTNSLGFQAQQHS